MIAIRHISSFQQPPIAHPIFHLPFSYNCNGVEGLDSGEYRRGGFALNTFAVPPFLVLVRESFQKSQSYIGVYSYGSNGVRNCESRIVNPLLDISFVR